MAQRSDTATEDAPINRGGRPPKLGPQAVEQLRALVLQHPNATVEYLQRLLKQHLGVQLSHQGMYRYLRRAGFKRVAVAAPDLQSPNKSRFEPVAASRYGYKKRHRDEGDTTRYPGTSALSTANASVSTVSFCRRICAAPRVWPSCFRCCICGVFPPRILLRRCGRFWGSRRPFRRAPSRV